MEGNHARDSTVTMTHRIRMMLLRYAALIALCAFMLLPLVWAAVSSLKPLEEVYVFPPTFRVHQPQWSNFREAFTRLPVARFLANSVFIAGVSVVGAVLTSSMAGYVLARVRFRGRSFCFMLVLGSVGKLHYASNLR